MHLYCKDFKGSFIISSGQSTKLFVIFSAKNTKINIFFYNISFTKSLIIRMSLNKLAIAKKLLIYLLPFLD